MTVATVDGGGDIANGLWQWFDIGLVDGIVLGFAKVSGGIGLILNGAKPATSGSTPL